MCEMQCQARYQDESTKAEELNQEIYAITEAIKDVTYTALCRGIRTDMTVSYIKSLMAELDDKIYKVKQMLADED